MSRYQKGKTNLDFTEARDCEWQRHQLENMQVCTSLQTDNHANTHHSVKSKTTTYNKTLATKIVADWELKVLNPAMLLAARSIHQIARPYDTRLANVAYVQGFKF